MSSSPRLLHWTSLCVGLVCSACACSKATDGMSFEQRLAAAATHTEAALQRVRERWFATPLREMRLDQLGLEFDSELEAIAEVTDDSLLEYARIHEGNDRTAKFIVMANYFRDQDDRIREIAEYFSASPDSGHRDQVPPRAPEVTAQWARPNDRLAWEYHLLRPVGRSNPRGAYIAMRAPIALRWVGDSASAMTLKLAIMSTLTDKAVPIAQRNSYLRRMVGFLASIAGQQSLDALLDFPSWINAAPAYANQKGTDPASSSPPEPLTVLLDTPAEELRTALRWDKRGRWKQVIAEFAEAATPERRAQLAAMLGVPLADLLKGQQGSEGPTGPPNK